MITSHTDVVGSLLRPPELLQARSDYSTGRISAAAFKAVEDRSVDAAIDVQEEAGLTVITDGEMRRLSFQSQLPEAVDGFGTWDLDAFLWGDWHGDQTVGEWRRARPQELGATSKLRRKRHLSAEEFTYLRRAPIGSPRSPFLAPASGLTSGPQSVPAKPTRHWMPSWQMLSTSSARR
jgi:5-methyltetrahydropteroyltriglutamate--homocysteine methyltransferase